MPFKDGPPSWGAPDPQDALGFAIWDPANDDWNVLCERCGWSGWGLPSYDEADKASDEHLRLRHPEAATTR